MRNFGLTSTSPRYVRNYIERLIGPFTGRGIPKSQQEFILRAINDISIKTKRSHKW